MFIINLIIFTPMTLSWPYSTSTEMSHLPNCISFTFRYCVCVFTVYVYCGYKCIVGIWVYFLWVYSVCICGYAWVYICMFVCMCVLCMFICVYKSVCMGICVSTYVQCLCMYTYWYMCVKVCICVCVYVYFYVICCSLLFMGIFTAFIPQIFFLS